MLTKDTKVTLSLNVITTDFKHLHNKELKVHEALPTPSSSDTFYTLKTKSGSKIAGVFTEKELVVLKKEDRNLRTTRARMKVGELYELYFTGRLYIEVDRGKKDLELFKLIQNDMPLRQIIMESYAFNNRDFRFNPIIGAEILSSILSFIKNDGSMELWDNNLSDKEKTKFWNYDLFVSYFVASDRKALTEEEKNKIITTYNKY